MQVEFQIIELMASADHIQFSKEELERYSRHLIIPEFNIEGQKKLKAARVLVIGTGGLGAPLLLYLTAAGIGTIGIVDFDVVDASNLQRQVLFTTDDVGRKKTEAARDRLQKLNPHVDYVLHNSRLDASNALEIISQYDVIADGTDNFPTRFLVNDASVLAGKVNVYASIFRFEGQLSVFNYVDKTGKRGPNYRDLFPSPPPPGFVPSCAEGGVIGVLPGILGSLQANEVIKVVSGVGEPLSGKLFQFDASSFTTRTLKISLDPDNPLTGENPTQTSLVDYEVLCGISPQNNTQLENSNQEITVRELKQWLDEKRPFRLVDVREPYEFEIVNLGGVLIPKATALDHLDQFPGNETVIVHCRSGKRSQDVIDAIKGKTGQTNLINLKGGILAWADEIDPTMAKY